MLLAVVVIAGNSAWADSPQEERRNRAADRIEQAFERDRILGRFDLDADSEDGHIELEGKVQNKAQRNRAVSVARRVAPGYRIVNKIEMHRSGFMGRHR